jgi:hypothetical protein
VNPNQHISQDALQPYAMGALPESEIEPLEVHPMACDRTGTRRRRFLRWTPVSTPRKRRQSSTLWELHPRPRGNDSRSTSWFASSDRIASSTWMRCWPLSVVEAGY